MLEHMDIKAMLELIDRPGSPTDPLASRVEEEIRTLTERALGLDPWSALAGQRMLLDGHLPWLQRRTVSRARAEGADWGDIGRSMGRSRQAVRQRFGARNGVGDLLPPIMPMGPEEALAREMRARRADLARLQALDEAEDSGELVPW